MRNNLPLLLLIVAWYFIQGPGAGAFPLGPNKITAVAYVYERNDNPVPDGVEGALQAIEIPGVIIEDDGNITPRWQGAYDAAKKAGLPCLVLLPSLKTIKVESYEDVTNAVGFKR